MARLTDIGNTLTVPKRIFTETVDLWKSVREELSRLGDDADLNHFDVSQIINMHALFSTTKFCGDVSLWDVSNVEIMEGMFAYTKFNGSLDLWDTSNLINSSRMFHKSDFDGHGIEKWDVRNVKYAQMMFSMSNFNSDISGWNLEGIIDMSYMFFGTPLVYSMEPLVKYVRLITDVTGILDDTKSYKYPRNVFNNQRKKLLKEETPNPTT